MKILPLIASLTSVFFTGVVSAHAHATKTVPADGSIVDVAPSSIIVNFSEAARLTALSIQKENDGPQKLGPLPTDAAKQVAVAAPALTPGAYTVSWRAVSGDNHVASGKFLFTIAKEKTTDHSTHH